MANDPGLTSERWVDTTAAIWIVWGIVLLVYAGMLLYSNLDSSLVPNS
jgi:hypothetical protein